MLASSIYPIVNTLSSLSGDARVTLSEYGDTADVLSSYSTWHPDSVSDLDCHRFCFLQDSAGPESF